MGTTGRPLVLAPLADQGEDIDYDIPSSDLPEEPLSRRFYLVAQTMLATGCDVWTAVEAVSTTAIEHPEWDMDEMRLWAAWETDAHDA